MIGKGQGALFLTVRCLQKRAGGAMRKWMSVPRAKPAGSAWINKAAKLERIKGKTHKGKVSFGPLGEIRKGLQCCRWSNASEFRTAEIHLQTLRWMARLRWCFAHDGTHFSARNPRKIHSNPINTKMFPDGALNLKFGLSIFETYAHTNACKKPFTNTIWNWNLSETFWGAFCCGHLSLKASSCSVTVETATDMAILFLNLTDGELPTSGEWPQVCFPVCPAANYCQSTVQAAQTRLKRNFNIIGIERPALCECSKRTQF